MSNKKKKDYGRTMRPGGEVDMRVPVNKRKDSYGVEIVKRYLEGQRFEMSAKAYQDFADDVDKGMPGLDVGHRDSARLHAESVRGHDKMTKKSQEAIARSMYKTMKK